MKPLARIVIIDAFAIVRRGIRQLVETQGKFLVAGEASDGREALRLAREINPVIVILGCSLPGLKGTELTHQIRQACPRTENLIYTNINSEAVMLDAFRAGARGFVHKTDDSHHLVDALDALSCHRPYFSERASEVLLDRFLQSEPEEAGVHLSIREREVVQLIAEGYLNKQIGHRLDISTKTVESHRASVMHKLNLRTTADLVRYAIRNSIIQP